MSLLTLLVQQSFAALLFLQLLSADLLLCNQSVVSAVGWSARQVWSIRRDPAGGTKCDGYYVLVTSTRQAGQLGQRDTVLHGM